MRISYKWLQKYIKLEVSPNDLADKLTSIGLEVESVDFLGKKFDGFVIGEVKSVTKHPNADKLKICEVIAKVGDAPLQIVCGAPNVAVGQKVVLGTIGAVVPHNQHNSDGKPFVLSKVNIRGVDSFGMICSEKELGIGDDSSGILVVKESAKVGTAFSEYLGINDVAFEIGITPNRPDCLSHLGIARDIASIYGKKVLSPKNILSENKKVAVKKLVSVKVEDIKNCPRYTARVIQNVKIQESPQWLKQLLTSAGLRPINNVVDVTNFVMYEYGQPLHAFDFDTIAQQKIIVRGALNGEKFTTLDGKTHQLSGGEVLICDGEKAIALGGVMGGLNSEISESTTNVLLESAYFLPASVRKTAKKLGISTDASYRFERGIDPNIAAEASARAASLISELSGGTVVSGIIDVYPKQIIEKKIVLRPERVNKILGTNISSKEIVRILNSIQISTKTDKKKNLICTIPTFRPDLEQEIDLVEEIARLYGYNNIENKVSSEINFTKPDKSEQKINHIRAWCESNGLNEIVTNSLIDLSMASLFSDYLIRVKNPLSEELEVLRPSLLATMLNSVAYNYNHGATATRFFEIGSQFQLATNNEKGEFLDRYKEKNVLGICLSGEANPQTWHSKQREFDIYDIKGIVFSLLRSIGLDNNDLIYYNAPTSLTEMTIGIEINNTYVGFIGKCKQEILKKYKIEKDVFYAEFDIAQLTRFEYRKKYKEFSKFPTVVRDVAFLVKKNVTSEQVEKVIKNYGGSLVSSVNIFDVFEGETLGNENKSLAYTIKINSYERTLTEVEIENVVSQIVKAVIKECNATLRSI